jgi:hypothetical protein
MARKRNRQRTHSLLHQYRGVPRTARIAAVVIEDPYGLPSDQEAKLMIAKHTDRASEFVKSWQAPERAKITVIQSLRHDTLGKMFARHQIDQACYKAGRDYQALCEMAEVSPVRSIDPSMPPIANSQANDAGDLYRKAQAVRTLHRLETALARAKGVEGVKLIRLVLGMSYSIEAAAAIMPPKNDRHYGKQFRLCLNELAYLCGYVREGQKSALDTHDG